jgi:hypothetical protein
MKKMMMEVAHVKSAILSLTGALLLAILVTGVPATYIGQAGAGQMPMYRMVVPPMPPMTRPAPADIPGPAAPDWGTPQAPGPDNYYLDGDPATWWPDEFRSNPDPNIKLEDLKGYHFPPIFRWVTVDKRIVKPGDTITAEALVEDPTEVLPWAISFEGPQGRRTTMNLRFTPRKDNKSMFDGKLTIPKWAEPGIYYPYSTAINSTLGHSKGYFPEYLPGMKDLVFEVQPNPDADVMPPVVQDYGIGRPGESTSDGVAQTYTVDDSIMVWSKVTDNKSGIANVIVRILSPREKFKEITLRPWMGKPDYYVGYFKIPKHYEGGEYYTTTLWATDKAGKSRYHFFKTHQKLNAARFTLEQPEEIVDSQAPELITVWLDKQEGKLGDEVKVSVIMSDDMSGIGDIALSFAAYPSFADKRRIHLKKVPPRDVLQKAGFNIEENLWEGTFKTHRLDEPGDWKLTRVLARDNADNQLDMRRSEFPDLLLVGLNFEGGVRNLGGSQVSSTAAATQQVAGSQGQAPKIRRIDMTPPHPPRGACLNCHEP